MGPNGSSSDVLIYPPQFKEALCLYFFFLFSSFYVANYKITIINYRNITENNTKQTDTDARQAIYTTSQLLDTCENKINTTMIQYYYVFHIEEVQRGKKVNALF